MKKIMPIAITILLLTLTTVVHAEIHWLEAETFDETGGWSIDTQFVDNMGSPFLLATGTGEPVADAKTTLDVTELGKYRLWVRTRDWFPEKGHSPGKFKVAVGGKLTKATLGVAADGSDNWRWVDAGEVFDLPSGKVEVALKDLTGWWGRVDALVFAPASFTPSNDPEELAQQRRKYAQVPADATVDAKFDVVVVGAGPAGIGAAVAAARNGAKVALIQDRPIVGGNASDEIGIPPMGKIGRPVDQVNVTGLCEEFFPKQSWGAYAKSDKMEALIRNEPNITLYLNTRATGVTLSSGEKPKVLASGEKSRGLCKIASVQTINVKTGQRLTFPAPRVIDCTGHGWIGYYAGAEYRHGEEPRAEYDEPLAPEDPDHVPGPGTMGNNLYQAYFKDHKKPVAFVAPAWAHSWEKPSDFSHFGGGRRSHDPSKRPANFDNPNDRGRGSDPRNDPNGATHKKFWVEYGGMRDTIADGEKIRDELFRISLGLWDYAKNHNPATRGKNANRQLAWIAYVMGTRESRRLRGPYIMTQKDWDEQRHHADNVAFSDWGIDVHHSEGFWTGGKYDTIHTYHGRRIGVPYRALYSKNVQNLWMAGRCLSVSHIALGGTRVMRLCMQTGEAAGTAAAIATRHETDEAATVTTNHLGELQQTLLKDGCYLLKVAGNDTKNLARRAKVTASSSKDGGTPEKVVDGYSRVVGKDSHAWSPSDAKPTLTFTFEQPTKINVVHVTFADKTTRATLDTGAGSEVIASFQPSRDSRRIVLPLKKEVTSQTFRLTLDAPLPVCEVRLYDESTKVWDAWKKRYTGLKTINAK